MPASGVSWSTGGGGAIDRPSDCGGVTVLVADDAEPEPEPEPEPNGEAVPDEDLDVPPPAGPVRMLPGALLLLPLLVFGVETQLGGQRLGTEPALGSVAGAVGAAGGVGLGSGRSDGTPERGPLRLRLMPAADAGPDVAVTATAAASTPSAAAASSRRTEPVSRCGRGRRMPGSYAADLIPTPDRK